MSAWKRGIWPEGISINLLISFAAGLVYILIVLGPTPLNPKNISWLPGDPATHFLGWELLRQDPHWHWPLTFTDRIGYPLGDSIAFMDPLPLLAILLKLLSPLLPEPFQYFGLSAVISASLQFFFAARLCRMLFGLEIWKVALPSLFFLASPVMTWRFAGHYALANHWLILAALYIYFASHRRRYRSAATLGGWCALLAGVSVMVNIYLAFLVVTLLTAAAISCAWGRVIRTWQAVWIETAMLASCLLAGSALGFLRGGGYKAGGYREYSMNLFSLVDPGAGPSILLPHLRHFTVGQYEGYNYLGLGMILLAVIALAGLILQRPAFAVRRQEAVPLAAACVVLAIIALSTRITAGSVLLWDMDPKQRLTEYLAILRCSGRLFWAPYYVLFLTIFGGVLTVLGRRSAVAILAAAFAIQAADLNGLRNWLQGMAIKDWHSPLTSTVWSHLGEKHANLIVWPPYQCNLMTPAGWQGYRVFGLVAISQHMRINSYYTARPLEERRDVYCNYEFLELPLALDTAYVLNPSAAAVLPQPEQCHLVDKFLLCSAATDFGLAPAPPPPVPPMEESGVIHFGVDLRAIRYLLVGWYDVEPWGVWAQRSAVLEFRLSPRQLSQYGGCLLNLKMLVASRPVRYRISSAAGEVHGTFPPSRPPATRSLKVRVPLGSTMGGTQVITLQVDNPTRPSAYGFSTDTRSMGFALMDLTLVP